MTGAPRLAWISAEDPPDAFPDARLALAEPNGLLAAGGDLSPERLVAAYHRGIFPWSSAGEPPLWWCPDPRAVLLPGEFHLARRLRRRLRSGRFSVSVDQCFAAVIGLCAATRAEAGTWLTPDMIDAYTDLHRQGIAHSVECWLDGQLAGGVYGIGLGSVFFGESMVSVAPDASKVSLLALVQLARTAGIRLIDCQLPNPHLTRLGARLMPRREFLALLRTGTREAPLQRLAAEPARAIGDPAASG